MRAIIILFAMLVIVVFLNSYAADGRETIVFWYVGRGHHLIDGCIYHCAPL
jgi:hypothetical protein